MEEDNSLSREEQRILRAMGKKKPVVTKKTPPTTPTSTTPPKKLSPQSKPISTNTSNKDTPRESSTQIQNKKGLSEDDIARREQEFEKERERLRKVEEALMKNRKSVLDDLDTVVENLTLEKGEQNPMKQSPVSEPIVNKSQKASPPPKEKVVESSSSIQDYINDIDKLWERLNVDTLGRTSEPSELEKSCLIISKRKSEMGEALSIAMASDTPADATQFLSTYIKEVIASVKPVYEMCTTINIISFEFCQFAKTVDNLILSITKNLRYINDPTSQETVISHCIDLLDKSIGLFNVIYEDAKLGGTDKDQKVLSTQHQFNLLLKRLIESFTNITKQQILDSQNKSDVQTNLAQYIQETASFAQRISEILKQPLFEPQSFKDVLTSMIESIKKIHEILDDIKKDELMKWTKLILEKSLKLQDAHSNPDVPVDVLNAISGVLKFLIANVQIL